MSKGHGEKLPSLNQMDEVRLGKALKSLKVILIGDATELFEVATLALVLSIPRGTAVQLLRQLRVGLFHVGQRSYFRVSALDEAIFALTGWGAPGFASPGSHYKNARHGINRKYHTELETTAKTDEYVKGLDRAKLHDAMQEAAKTRGKTIANTVKRLSKLSIEHAKTPAPDTHRPLPSGEGDGVAIEQPSVPAPVDAAPTAPHEV